MVGDPVVKLTQSEGRDDVYFFVGDTYTFTCDVEGQPLPKQVVWDVENVVANGTTLVNTSRSTLVSTVRKP